MLTSVLLLVFILLPALYTLSKVVVPEHPLKKVYLKSFTMNGSDFRTITVRFSVETEEFTPPTHGNFFIARSVIDLGYSVCETETSKFPTSERILQLENKSIKSEAQHSILKKLPFIGYWETLVFENITHSK